MDFPKAPNGASYTRIALNWPACDAKTVHVVFALSNWELPGIELERQPDGEFFCFLMQESFAEIFFKFVIDGTRWEVNPSIPVITDAYGYENNRWTLKEALEYHRKYVRRLRRRITLGNVNRAELCRLALSIHGQTDKDGCQLECVIDEAAPVVGRDVSFKLSMSGTFSEVVFLLFQPLGGQSSTEKQEVLVEPAGIDQINGELAHENDEKQNHEDRKGIHKSKDQWQKAVDVWVAKFPADFFHKELPACYESISEKERLMESECATMRFLNEYTEVPAPKIYAYDVRYSQFPSDEKDTQDLCKNGSESVDKNKIGWPFILMENLGTMPFLPYWSLMGDPPVGDRLSDEWNQLRQLTFEKMATYQIQLAKHPLSACGYLTLGKTYWQAKTEANGRKTSTPKSAFGIRPCIYDTCEPFTNSIISAFDNPPGQWLFPPARAFNSLNSITARFQHLLTHGNVKHKIDHFIAIWQLRAMLYEIFGARYENGPFILQHPDLLPHNIFVSEEEDDHIKISGIIDWEHATAVPVQIAACPPRLCLGRILYHYLHELETTGNMFQSNTLFNNDISAKHRAEYYANMKLYEARMTKDGQDVSIWKGFEGEQKFLSEVLREEMVLPVYLLDELCSGFLHKSMTGKIADKYLPIIFEMVKGYRWEDVKEAVVTKGVMRFVLDDCLDGEEQRLESSDDSMDSK